MGIPTENPENESSSVALYCFILKDPLEGQILEMIETERFLKLLNVYFKSTLNLNSNFHLSPHNFAVL